MELLKGRHKIVIAIVVGILTVFICLVTAFLVNEKNSKNEVIDEVVSETTESAEVMVALDERKEGESVSVEATIEVTLAEGGTPAIDTELWEEAVLSADAQAPEELSPSIETESTEAVVTDVHVCGFEIFETSATCLTAGKVEERCPKCGKVNWEQQVEPLGHKYQKSIWETATCLKGGYYNNVCQRCGLVESTTEDPLPHDVENIVVQEGNCMEDTIIKHICKSCGQQVESDTRFTPQTHKWVNGVVDGSEVSYCEWCGVVQ